jgi:hypothetical protein
MATALVVVPVACKDDVRKNADNAADHLKDQKQDLKDEAKDVKDVVKDTAKNARDLAKSDTEVARKVNEEQLEHNGKEIKKEVGELAKKVEDVKVADYEFDLRRRDRVEQLRLVHGVVSTQPLLINTLSNTVALTDKARANLAEKMQKFQMRLDEAGNAIEVLQTVDENKFEDRNDEASKAMERLKNARDAAWEALNDGDRIQPS